jgi:hypothetical protein
MALYTLKFVALPELFVEKGLSLSQVIEATLEGYRLGEADAKAEGLQIRVVSYFVECVRTSDPKKLLS